MSRTRMAGVTLMELMIVVAIIGTLGVIAIPAYRGYTERTHRTEALNGMNLMMSNQQNFRLVNGTFTNNLAALGFDAGCTANCVYLVTFDVAPDTQTYTARFAPNPAGGSNGISQMSDDDCSWFTIDARGRRDAENDICLEGR